MMTEQTNIRYVALDDGDICVSCGEPSERDSQLCKDCMDKASGESVDRALELLDEMRKLANRLEDE